MLHVTEIHFCIPSWRQNMVVAASWYEDAFLQQRKGKLTGVVMMINGVKYRAILKRNLFSSVKAIGMVVSSSSRIMTLNIQLELQWNIRSKHISVLEWTSQIPDTNPTENLWQHLKIGVHRWLPSNLSELELFYKEWLKISVSWCVKLVEIHSKRSAPVIAAEGVSTECYNTRDLGMARIDNRCRCG